MTAWLSAWGEPAAAEMADDMTGMDMRGTTMNGMSQPEVMDELGGLSGAAFDARFLVQMTAHHQGAITMAHTELDDGENPDARALAQKIIDAQTAEIATMTALAAEKLS